MKDEFRNEPTKAEHADGSQRMRQIGPRHVGAFRIYPSGYDARPTTIAAPDGSWELDVRRVVVREGVQLESYAEGMWCLEGNAEIQVLDDIAYITQRGSHG